MVRRIIKANIIKEKRGIQALFMILFLVPERIDRLFWSRKPK